MSFIDKVISILPEVSRPEQKKLAFSTKFKWTIVVLVFFFLLGKIQLFGVASSSLDRYANLALLLGAKFGSLISLGIGPIVTASIILQLLNGAGILSIDTSTPQGKKKYQGIQQLTSFFFIIFESIVYVMLGGLSPDPMYLGSSTYSILQFLIIFQLFLGGFMIMLMDEIVQKWGFGSGISLFIAAGVSETIFVRMFSWVKPVGSDYSVGAVWSFFQGLSNGALSYSFLMLSGILVTLLVFGIAIYFQSMKVEIPLSFGRIRGHGIRWPLNFLYTSNIPVILIAALLANLQIAAQLLSKVFPAINPQAIQGWVTGPRLLPLIIQNHTLAIGWLPYAQALVYLLIFLGGSILFSWFWVQASGLDAKSQAKNILKSGLQVPGFRKDPRVIERLLDRYIKPLTVMGAIAVALIATFADMTGAFGTGTGILLTVMIIYKLYEDIAKEHLGDMNPAMRRFMGNR